LNPESRIARPAVLALVVVAVLGGAVTLLFGGGEPPLDEMRLLEARAVAQDHRLALAKEPRFYLFLEPEAGTLSLYHGAALLRAFPVQDLEVGHRRVVGGATVDGEDWRSRVWDGPRVEPPVHRERQVIVSDSVEPPDLAGSVDWIPPTPEEAVPTPKRFVIHFHGGLGLEVTAERSDSATVHAGPWARMSHAAARVLPRNWDRYRIRVAMDAVEAGALYRSLPDSVGFLAVLPGR
jgi:hypothetical protein